MQDDTAGDPISGIKWARKAAAKISLQLRRLRIWVSASTVRRLLKQLDFHLHVNKKTICSSRSADPRSAVQVHPPRAQPIRTPRAAYTNPILPA